MKMKFIKPNKILLLTASLIVPFTLAYLSDSFFKNSSKEVLSQIEKTSGLVAGTSKTAIKDITDQIPIMPGAEIISVDTSNQNTSVTLESDKTEQEIKDYYKIYASEKENINISGNIIKITLKN